MTETIEQLIEQARKFDANDLMVSYINLAYSNGRLSMLDQLHFPKEEEIDNIQ